MSSLPDQADFDPYRVWLGIPKQQQPPHHYRLLGLEVFEPDLQVIQEAADRQIAHLKTKQTGKHVALSQILLQEVAVAAGCLLDNSEKAEYDQQLRKKLAPLSLVPAAVAPQPVLPRQTVPPVPAPRVPAVQTKNSPAPAHQTPANSLPLHQTPAQSTPVYSTRTLPAPVVPPLPTPVRSLPPAEIREVGESPLASIMRRLPSDPIQFAMVMAVGGAVVVIALGLLLVLAEEILLTPLPKVPEAVPVAPVTIDNENMPLENTAKADEPAREIRPKPSPLKQLPPAPEFRPKAADVPSIESTFPEAATGDLPATELPATSDSPPAEESGENPSSSTNEGTFPARAGSI
ncbi:hypothetical protein NA78x_001270 [Anatilimnocola sp. NA78]|uniref:hypothetical protein n=1 Tax=Anatilimnocola sp. NA78 TaxID=3415683 RepID=UPI003CE4ABB8